MREVVCGRALWAWPTAHRWRGGGARVILCVSVAVESGVGGGVLTSGRQSCDSGRMDTMLVLLVAACLVSTATAIGFGPDDLLVMCIEADEIRVLNGTTFALKGILNADEVCLCWG